MIHARRVAAAAARPPSSPKNPTGASARPLRSCHNRPCHAGAQPHASGRALQQAATAGAAHDPILRLLEAHAINSTATGAPPLPLSGGGRSPPWTLDPFRNALVDLSAPPRLATAPVLAAVCAGGPCAAPIAGRPHATAEVTLRGFGASGHFARLRIAVRQPWRGHVADTPRAVLDVQGGDLLYAAPVEGAALQPGHAVFDIYIAPNVAECAAKCTLTVAPRAAGLVLPEVAAPRIATAVLHLVWQPGAGPLAAPPPALVATTGHGADQVDRVSWRFGRAMAPAVGARASGAVTMTVRPHPRHPIPTAKISTPTNTPFAAGCRRRRCRHDSPLRPRRRRCGRPR